MGKILLIIAINERGLTGEAILGAGFLNI